MESGWTQDGSPIVEAKRIAAFPPWFSNNYFEKDYPLFCQATFIQISVCERMNGIYCHIWRKFSSNIWLHYFVELTGIVCHANAAMTPEKIAGVAVLYCQICQFFDKMYEFMMMMYDDKKLWKLTRSWLAFGR